MRHLARLGDGKDLRLGPTPRTDAVLRDSVDAACRLYADIPALRVDTFPGLLVREHVGVHLRDPWLLRHAVWKAAHRTIDAATLSPCDGQAARQVRISPTCCVRTVPGITRSRQGARRHAANSVEVGPSRQGGTTAGS